MQSISSLPYLLVLSPDSQYKLPQLREAEQRKAALQEQVTDCSNKLRRAEQLISGLGGEKAAWGRFSAELLEKYKNVTGDIVLAAGASLSMTNKFEHVCICNLLQ